MTSSALATLKDRHMFVASELEKARPRINALIPPGMGLMASRAISIVLDALARDPKLLDCDGRSIVRAVMHASELGLELGSPLGEAYLVPFKGKATMMVGYRGFLRLIHGSPRVAMVKGVIVRASDDFEVDEGNNKLRHVWHGDIKQRGDITFAYSRVYYVDGSSRFEVMDRVELDMIKTEAIARSHGFTPWKSPAHVSEMYKKCPLRRQAKWLELSPLTRKAVEFDDLESMQRGEFGALRERDGFSANRLAELKDMLAARDGKVDPIDAEIDEETP